MTTPQPGIFTEASPHHHYLEYGVDTDADLAALKQALRDIRSGDGGVYRVIAFGSDLWARLAPGAVPENFRPFEEIKGVDGHIAPSTQRGVFIWLHGDRLDDVLEAALDTHNRLKPVAALELDERGFIYHDKRDLTGFIDGTANPKDDDRFEAALIPAGETGAGGSFVLTQLWLHDLDAFNALPVDEQERVIGRTKPDSIELEGDAMPPDSHVSRTDVSEDGVTLKIWRRSAPFGTAGRHGLFFLAFACAIHRFDVQLQRMYGVSGDGEHDRLIEFSTAVTGAYWFAPSLEDLQGLSAA